MKLVATTMEAYLSFRDKEGLDMYNIDSELQPWASKGFSFAGIVYD
jgi:hypothetical protein